jgi:hypothetical protein
MKCPFVRFAQDAPVRILLILAAELQSIIVDVPETVRCISCTYVVTDEIGHAGMLYGCAHALVCEGEWLEKSKYQRLYANHPRFLCDIVNIFFGLTSCLTENTACLLYTDQSQ